MVHNRRRVMVLASALTIVLLIVGCVAAAPALLELVRSIHPIPPH
jgi:hypothetical protein